MKARLALTALAGALAVLLAPSAFAQAKSNIQDDPNSSSCTENCIDAGYEWAIANTPATEADCAAKNEDFAAGCTHWLEEQREAAAPPPEEPTDAAAPPPDDSAAPPPEDAPPADGSEAPPPDDSQSPPPDSNGSN